MCDGGLAEILSAFDGAAGKLAGEGVSRRGTGNVLTQRWQGEEDHLDWVENRGKSFVAVEDVVFALAALVAAVACVWGGPRRP